MTKAEQHIAYNKYVGGLIEELENMLPELGVFSRLLAMETDFRDWTQHMVENPVPDPGRFITDDMLAMAEDAQVRVLVELRKEVWDLLIYLGNYWQSTDEARSEMN